MKVDKIKADTGQLSTSRIQPGYPWDMIKCPGVLISGVDLDYNILIGTIILRCF